SRRGSDAALVQVLERQLGAAVDPEAQRALLLRIAAVSEERIGDGQAGIRALERALDLDPAHAETREALAAAYRRAGRLHDLAILLGRARDLASDPAERFDLQTRLAGLYETDLEDDDKAREAWALAHELDGDRPEPLDALER